MEYIINDSVVEASIDSFGAELKSLRILKSNEEFMWDANPKFWGRTSPVLFPIVGGLKANKYTYNEKSYRMGQHGFARDNEFEMISRSKTRILFLLKSTVQTLELYPFSFKFYMEYSLVNGRLNIQYKVENITNNNLYFSLGAHPAFSTPTNSSVKFSDYYLEFEKKETASVFSLEGRNISRKRVEFLKDEKIIKLKEDTFKNDAIIFKDLDSKVVSLKCKKTKRIVTMDYSEFDYIAFWNSVGAEFVCLEPWNGIADFVDASGILEEKDGVIKLESKSIYMVNLGIEVKN